MLTGLQRQGSSTATNTRSDLTPIVRQCGYSVQRQPAILPASPPVVISGRFSVTLPRRSNSRLDVRWDTSLGHAALCAGDLAI